MTDPNKRLVSQYIYPTARIKQVNQSPSKLKHSNIQTPILNREHSSKRAKSNQPVTHMSHDPDPSPVLTRPVYQNNNPNTNITSFNHTNQFKMF